MTIDKSLEDITQKMWDRAHQDKIHHAYAVAIYIDSGSEEYISNDPRLLDDIQEELLKTRVARKHLKI